MTLAIRPRDSWGAVQPKWSWSQHLPIIYVFSSYTNSDPCYLTEHCEKEVRYLQGYYMRNGRCPDIRYSFLVGGDGTVYEGRGWYTRPGLPPKYCNLNKRSLYIGLMGTFEDRPPNDIMFSARDELLQYGVREKLIFKRFLEFNIEPAGIR